VATEIFNLAPPPHFRGLDPHKPLSVYYRHMPHWRQDGATYFVTFRLGESLPQAKLDFLRQLRAEWERVSPAARTKELNELYARNLLREVESSLDEGHGACHFHDARLSAVLEEGLFHFQGQRYFVGCWVFMPNHCHCVIRPFDEWPLEKILQGLKSAVARQCNSILSASGTFWQDESYDHIVRDEEHLWRIVQYIGRNPSKARIPRAAWRRWIHPEWEAAGYGFIDK
jgi:hypothetical protein